MFALGACRHATAPPPPTPRPSVSPPSPATSTTAPAPVGVTKLLLVRGGEFMMGCLPADEACEPAEPPSHKVRVKPFWLDEHEVTAAQYDQCIDAGVCPQVQVTDLSGMDPSGFAYNSRNPQRRHHPANGINYFNAKKYCAWVGKRLPREDEFEFALRGGMANNIYPWGNGPPTSPVGNYSDESLRNKHLSLAPIPGYRDGFVGTAPYCSFPRNPFNFCDLSGNVWEWCEDPPDAPPHMHVVRGGSWHNDLPVLRSSTRQFFASDGYPHIGFRCARDAQ
jgi:formylglycine-generating enzyme required for sulfatase activity